MRHKVSVARSSLRWLVLGCVLVALTSPALIAGPITITFDSLLDSEILTNQYSAQGVNFANAIGLTAGVSLNEFEFPPRSNFNVISDNGGPISILFSLPQSSVFAFFTYAQGLTMQAFDASDASLGSVTSLAGCASNLALSGTAGCSPNEQLSLSGVGAIARVTIAGDSGGGSFVMDDLNFDNPLTSGSPEPSTTFLIAIGLGAIAVLRRR